MVDKNSDTDFFAPTSAILESISDGVFTVDQNLRVTSFNRAAEAITGIPRGEALGKLCSEVFKSSMCETECALRLTLKNGKPLINKHGYIIDAEGERIPVSVSTAVLHDEEGKVIGGAELARQCTRARKQNSYKSQMAMACNIVTISFACKWLPVTQIFHI